MNNLGASNPTGSYLQSLNSYSSQPSNGAAAGQGGVGSAGAGQLGFNMDTAQLALGGIQTIGSLWQAWEANKLAREQFKFQKEFATTNLTNSIQSYNTTLQDRGRSRAFTESQTPDQAAAYIKDNSLAQASFS